MKDLSKFRFQRKLSFLLTGLILAGILCGWAVLRRLPEPPAAVPSTSDRSDRRSSNDSDDSDRLAAAAALPLPRQDDQYVTSSVCRSCHPQEHASWHDSYHRSMTQRVTPDTVLADFAHVTLATRGREFRLWRDGENYWAELVDPEWDEAERAAGRTGDAPDAPRVTREVVMSTGSHHFQTYWINGREGNELWQVPWVWELEKQRWLPAEDAFLAPPELPRRVTQWNDNCIQCHAVGGQPGKHVGGEHFISRVAELGIACEACHGPGKPHVDYHRARSGEAKLAVQLDRDPIVNPAKLPHDRGSQVCGQCHSYFSFSDESFWQAGFTYRPGDDLHATRIIHDFGDDYVQSRADLKVGYWEDGTMRLAGREFSALDDSRCFQAGELSCFSCHSLHRYDQPADQLRADLRGDETCLQCHENFRETVAAHTHHAASSSGSRCYNCHMPHTSFGLLKGIRSHRIDSPTARMTAEYGRPNACNLCHVNETLDWTADKLHEWYGQPMWSSDNGARQPISVMLELLLAGDAAQRAVVAWNLGRPEVIEQSPPWPAPFLALTLLDPYSAVRSVAYESLRKYPGFQDFTYDFLAAPAERNGAMRQAIERWRAQLPAQPAWSGSSFLLRSDGSMDIESVQQLMGARDNRPILLPE